MAACRRVYDSRHLQAACQELGSAPEPYARQSSMGFFTSNFALIFPDRCTRFYLPNVCDCFAKYQSVLFEQSQCVLLIWS